MSEILKVGKSRGLQGQVHVPGDKSISHRAVMFGALAEGRTVARNFLMGADCLSTVSCYRQLGVRIKVEADTVTIEGVGLHGLKEPQDILDVGNSGTTMRLLAGILSGQPFFSVMTGDATIRRRPMARVVEPLRQMGAKINGRQAGNLAPLVLEGAQLQAITYTSPVASAQVKSAILLAGLYAKGQTSVSEPHKSRDHTERMLRSFGVEVEEVGNKVTIAGGQNLKGLDLVVPGDISSAAFWLVAGSIVPNSRLELVNVGINPTRDGILECLTQMGAKLTIKPYEHSEGEPRADIIVESSTLKGIEIGGSIIPRLIDEIPVIAVAAAYAQGTTVIRDAEELKVKESNRISTTVTELRKFGVDIRETEDGMIIKGGNTLKASECESYHDHRIAMAMAVAGLGAEGKTVITNSECIDVSFPGFSQILQQVSQ